MKLHFYGNYDVEGDPPCREDGWEAANIKELVDWAVQLVEEVRTNIGQVMYEKSYVGISLWDFAREMEKDLREYADEYRKFLDEEEEL